MLAIIFLQNLVIFHMFFPVSLPGALRTLIIFPRAAMPRDVTFHPVSGRGHVTCWANGTSANVTQTGATLERA